VVRFRAGLCCFWLRGIFTAKDAKDAKRDEQEATESAEERIKQEGRQGREGEVICGFVLGMAGPFVFLLIGRAETRLDGSRSLNAGRSRV
jgi:hypothetical protein